MVDGTKPDNEKRFERKHDPLWEAVRECYTKIEPFREARAMFIKHFAGNYYGTDPVGRIIPDNLLNLYVTILTRLLAPSNPRAFIDTYNSELKPHAYSFELAMNRMIERMDLESTLESFVQDAMFAMGVVKTGVRIGGTMPAGDSLIDTTEPYVTHVPFEDFAWDLTAKRYEDVQWAADRYNMTLREIREQELFDPAAIDELESIIAQDTIKDSSIHATSDLLYENSEDLIYDRRIDLWDVWLPDEDKLVTFPANETAIRLREVEYYGPESGPYELLRLLPINGQVMPISPCSLIFQLHITDNELFEKTRNQADRQKKVNAVKAGGEDDAAKLVAAKDGQVVGVNSTEAVQEINFGGPDASIIAFNHYVRDLMKTNAGNIDQLGGLDSSAPTLGQEQMLASNASEQVKGMQKKVVKAVGNIMKAIGWFMWEDPFTDIEISKSIPGMGDAHLYSRFSGEDKIGLFNQYDIAIHPYSMQDRAPQEQVNSLMTIISQFLMPLLPYIQEQGMDLDYAEILGFLADRGNMPILADVVVTQGDGSISNFDRQSRPTQQQPRQAAVTERHNFRHQVPSQQNSDGGMQQLLASLTQGDSGNN